MHVFKALLDLLPDLLLRGLFQDQLVEEVTMLIPNEVEDFALRKRRDSVTVLPVSIEKTVDLHLTIK